MKEDDKIRQKFGTETGFTVPDGFFEQKFAQISASLPAEKPKPAIKVKPGMWQRLKPYVYLAAMFAGLWCTMKLVKIAGSQQDVEVGNVNLDNPPALVAKAMASPEVAAQVIGTGAVTVPDVKPMEVEETKSKNNDETPNIEPEVVEAYQNSVGTSDIDLTQLRAELESDDTDEAMYYCL